VTQDYNKYTCYQHVFVTYVVTWMLISFSKFCSVWIWVVCLNCTAVYIKFYFGNSMSQNSICSGCHCSHSFQNLFIRLSHITEAVEWLEMNPCSLNTQFVVLRACDNLMNLKTGFEVFTFVWLRVLFWCVMRCHGQAEQNPSCYSHRWRLRVVTGATAPGPALQA
jgi:hypothetical protein